MTNYEQDTLSLIKGDTPKEKYNNMLLINALLENIATPRRGTEEENWDIMDVVNYINAHDLLTKTNP